MTEYVVPDPAHGLFTTYANNVQLGYTVYDLRLIFGELVEMTAEKVTIEQRVQVTISWLQAKVLSELLSRSIAECEEQNGGVRMPAGILT